ncbi:uncharacterized protein [Triticum aestivum]|uniref:uncharacterized protein n=1 Tax=Triticum aestivum TaxID=4565 RepID=UPI001D033260|nr:uncharacterized protein LOC123139252 [Triticum aestivum]
MASVERRRTGRRKRRSDDPYLARQMSDYGICKPLRAVVLEYPCHKCGGFEQFTLSIPSSPCANSLFLFHPLLRCSCPAASPPPPRRGASRAPRGRWLVRRGVAPARAPRGQRAAAGNTSRRSNRTGSVSSRAGSSQYGEAVPVWRPYGLRRVRDLAPAPPTRAGPPPCVVPTRITKLPNSVRDSASPPRMSREQHRDGEFGCSALMMPSEHNLLVFSMRKKMI